MAGVKFRLSLVFSGGFRWRTTWMDSLLKELNTRIGDAGTPFDCLIEL